MNQSSKTIIKKFHFHTVCKHCLLKQVRKVPIDNLQTGQSRFNPEKILPLALYYGKTKFEPIEAGRKRNITD
jgi:hypothetical protein